MGSHTTVQPGRPSHSNGRLGRSLTPRRLPRRVSARKSLVTLLLLVFVAETLLPAWSLPTGPTQPAAASAAQPGGSAPIDPRVEQALRLGGQDPGRYFPRVNLPQPKLSGSVPVDSALVPAPFEGASAVPSPAPASTPEPARVSAPPHEPDASGPAEQPPEKPAVAEVAHSQDHGDKDEHGDGDDDDDSG